MTVYTITAAPYGGVAEWLKAAVLKTAKAFTPLRGFAPVIRRGALSDDRANPKVNYGYVLRIFLEA